jgi:tRNA threonylcarbamoyladenosine biosynthesis protein TsaE
LRALGLKEISVKYLTFSVEKTVWLGRQLGIQLIDGDISPTFTLVNEYKGRHQLFHIDLYRLKNKTEIMALDLEDYLSGEGVVVIEWADRWPGDLSGERIEVDLRIVDEHTRELTFSGGHPRAKEIIRALKERVGISLKEIE